MTVIKIGFVAGLVLLAAAGSAFALSGANGTLQMSSVKLSIDLKSLEVESVALPE